MGSKWLFVGVALAVCTSGLSAQTQPSDPAATARMRIGPLALTPTVSLSNVGVDTNVFNSWNDPKEDFTATLSPQSAFWLHAGRARLSGTAQVSYVYFANYPSERAVNTRDDARLELRFNRITPYVSDTFLNARERPGYEIDARARHVENTVSLGTDIRVGGKTTVNLAVASTKVRFDGDVIFRGTSLSEVLNRTAEGMHLSARHHITPLTKVVIEAEAQRDRFALSPIRDTDSVRIMPGLDFDPFAPISGSARVGYRKFDAFRLGRRSQILVASVDVGYRFLGNMRVAVHTERDIAYSYEVEAPFYLQTGVSGTVTRRITGRWDVQATGGRYRLDYEVLGAPGVGVGRIEDIRTVGGGIGFFVGRGRRLGVNVDKYRRSSNIQTREYNSVRVGTSISYGF